ncbi:MAG: hypothetical protein J6B92_05575 [Paraprevotella sp.]|jgi:hypothetical protein|nr:hypothetical protein [Paraprevotella sp.]MBP3472853.1 hypothetical protein [Paraprevotella sp.]
MNKKRMYISPVIEIFPVVCEQGILAGSTLGDKNPGDIGMETSSINNIFEESSFDSSFGE